MRHITWQEVQVEAERIANQWRGRVQTVYGVPQGGAPLAVMVANLLGAELIAKPTIGMATLGVSSKII